MGVNTGCFGPGGLEKGQGLLHFGQEAQGFLGVHCGLIAVRIEFGVQ